MSWQWVYVGGTFDLFHPGHVNFLRQAALVGPVVVALNTDEFAARYKRRPIMRLEERIAVVEACCYADEVRVNDGDEDSRVTVQRLLDDGFRVRWVAHGDDWTGDSLARQMGFTDGWLEERGISMRYVPYTAGVSTSDIIERIR